jgi:peptide deformylase
MALRSILVFPDARLTHACEPIVDFGQPLQRLLQDLWDTLAASPGVGLAAPQIGVRKRVSVIDLTRRKLKKGSAASPAPYVIVNPILIEGSGEQIPREGCLSVPEFLGNVKRFERVVVESLDEHGHPQRKEAAGFEALALQHEMDHMDGKLFLDRIMDLKGDLFQRKTTSS